MTRYVVVQQTHFRRRCRFGCRILRALPKNRSSDSFNQKSRFEASRVSLLHSFSTSLNFSSFLVLLLSDILDADDCPAGTALARPSPAATSLDKKRSSLGVEHPRLCDWSLAQILSRCTDAGTVIGCVCLPPIRPALSLAIHG